MKFWIPWGVATVVTAITLYFFVIGLADGTVSWSNAGLWMVALVGTVGVTAGSYTSQNATERDSPIPRWLVGARVNWTWSSDTFLSHLPPGAMTRPRAVPTTAPTRAPAGLSISFRSQNDHGLSPGWQPGPSG